MDVAGGPIFDGTTFHRGMALRLEGSRVVSLVPENEAGGDAIDLGGDILSPAYVDLQVNGGGGVMLNDDPSVETLARISTAHRGLGAATILPTLITDTPEATRAAIAAVTEAVAAGIPGIVGLHMEGPHLSRTKKGAHAADLIRPMTTDDLDALCRAAAALPVLMVTVAPESASEEQVRQLARAGAVVSLGHTDADCETCLGYARAGATCATHLFNAMSGLAARAPGLVGAALSDGGLSAGLIADGIHVHPATMGAAVRGKARPGRVFLVSDAMAPAGTDLATFRLNGREIRRTAGRLTLADGTLAGADLDLTRAVRVLVEEAGIELAEALAMATSIPARVAGMAECSASIVPGRETPLIRIAHDLSAARLCDNRP